MRSTAIESTLNNIGFILHYDSQIGVESNSRVRMEKVLSRWHFSLKDEIIDFKRKNKTEGAIPKAQCQQQTWKV